MSKINWRTIWIDPNWRHQLTNAVLATIAVGALGLIVTATLLMMKILQKWPLWSFMLIGALLGVLVAGLLWLFIRSDKEEKPPFLIDVPPGNCSFSYLIFQKQERVAKQIGVLIYDLKIANNTGNPTTLKEVMLRIGKSEILGVVLPTVDVKGEPSLYVKILSGGQLCFLGWGDIRNETGKDKGPGAIWRGSAFFVLGEDIKTISEVKSPQIVARDFFGNEAKCKISPENLNLEVSILPK